MRRAPYTFVNSLGPTQDIFHVVNLGQRLSALADGRPLQLQVLAPTRDDVSRVRVTAVPRLGPIEVLGDVVRPGTPALRERLAMAIALAEDDRRSRRQAA